MEKNNESGGINLSSPTSITLAKTLGPASIVFMGIGSLIGGGIFTLLGPAAGIAGPGLILSMILGSAVAFLNLQMYLALGTTFPEAGGGYLWVKKGLGNFQGFLAGWLSWFAHASACGVYALSFGFYGRELLHILNVSSENYPWLTSAKFIAFITVLIFGYINWKGAKVTAKASNVTTVILLIILFLFLAFGSWKMAISPEPFKNFSPFLPSGLLGVIAAASFFYIAFEGSEIQVQAGEETKNPARDLKIGLITSWAIVSLVYLLLSFVVIGATPSESGTLIGETLRSFGEGAIVRSAQAILPFGKILMLIAGVLANLAALNATIYSSSHVSFALARDKNIFSNISKIHAKNFTPYMAVAVSIVLIEIMILTLPLFDVASAASLLFIILFLQLNIAGINIHFKWPSTKWVYKVPFFPITPILASLVYLLLAFTMLKINATAWVVTFIWALIGLVNYYAYSMAQSREKFENEIVYEEALRVGPKLGKRILLPIESNLNVEELKNLVEISFALASHFDGEIIIAKIHEVPQALPLLEGAKMDHDRQILDNIKDWAEEFNQKTPGLKKDINFHNLLMAGRDSVETILDIVKMEDCDILLLNWEGYTHTKGTIFNYKIDQILREAKCDLLVVKNPRPIKSLIVTGNPAGTGAYAEKAGEIFKGLVSYFQPKTKLLGIIDPNIPHYFKPDHNPLLKSLGLKKKDFNEIEFARSKSIVSGVIENVKKDQADLMIIGATETRFLKEIRFGNISELLAKHLDVPLMIVKGYESLPRAIWKKITDKILNKKPA
jgi:amino acid transporter/nucleotide-binding universal stress UspA family protein